MRAVSLRALSVSRANDRTDIRAPEQSFGSILGDVSKVLWPSKTAANIAAIVGCSERAAEMYLAGDREWSGDAIAAIVAEILKRHSMRNVRVKSKQ